MGYFQYTHLLFIFSRALCIQLFRFFYHYYLYILFVFIVLDALAFVYIIFVKRAMHADEWIKGERERKKILPKPKNINSSVLYANAFRNLQVAERTNKKTTYRILTNVFLLSTSMLLSKHSSLVRTADNVPITIILFQFRCCCYCGCCCCRCRPFEFMPSWGTEGMIWCRFYSHAI